MRSIIAVGHGFPNCGPSEGGELVTLHHMGAAPLRDRFRRDLARIRSAAGVDLALELRDRWQQD